MRYVYWQSDIQACWLQYQYQGQSEMKDLYSHIVNVQSIGTVTWNTVVDVLYSYKLAENIDAQLKRMSSDLKEIVDHLNVSNSSTDSSDPVNFIAFSILKVYFCT